MPELSVVTESDINTATVLPDAFDAIHERINQMSCDDEDGMKRQSQCRQALTVLMLAFGVDDARRDK